MRTFYFDTGVKVYNHIAPVKVIPGAKVTDNGVLVIPFDCDDVPKGATFQFACDTTPPGYEHLLKREMHNTHMLSKYAFFRIPTS